MRPAPMSAILLVVSSIALADGHQHLATPPLSAAARALVHRTMESHSKDMTELVWAVVLLDYGRTSSLARGISAAPRIARTTGRDATELNAALSPRFFDLQDQLRERSRTLAESAAHRDAKSVSRAFGSLTETCVSCHDAFLNGD